MFILVPPLGTTTLNTFDFTSVTSIVVVTSLGHVRVSTVVSEEQRDMMLVFVSPLVSPPVSPPVVPPSTHEMIPPTTSSAV